MTVEPLRTLAARVCEVVEAPGDDRIAFAREVAPLLADLIAAAMRLPRWT